MSGNSKLYLTKAFKS